MPIITRRTALRGLFAAPAIVAVQNIMPVRSIERLVQAPFDLTATEVLARYKFLGEWEARQHFAAFGTVSVQIYPGAVNWLDAVVESGSRVLLAHGINIPAE